MSQWVTWENVGIDRIGCAWLIRRWIDHEATFVFIPQGQTSTPELGESFDIPNGRFSHRNGRCSFATFLEEYQLQDPILGRIASIIDDADTVQVVMLEPIAMGLEVICQGIRLRFSSS